MKNCILGLFIVLLFSCTGFFGIEEEEIRALNDPNGPNYNPTTFIKFENPRFYAADVYGTSSRVTKIIETVPSYGEKGPISWINTDRFDFYITYQLPLLSSPAGFSQKTIPYIPNNVNAAVVTAVIPRNTTTSITIPNLSNFINSNEILFQNNALLLIKNSGSSAFRLLNGGSVVPADISPNFINSGQTALYTLAPTSFISNLAIHTSNENSLPAEITSLQAGYIYIIDFNGAAASLADTPKLLTLDNL